ncbi:MAG: TIGR03086 family metal-binding protein, partial [Actinomycetota bacterium]
FTHAGLPDEAARNDHGHGWDHFVERLGVAAETGDAGWNPWAAGPEDLDLLSASEAALALLLETSRSLPDRALDQATPCEQFSVAELLDHLDHSLTSLGQVAGGAEPSGGVDQRPEARLASKAGTTLEAWRDRGLEGELDFAGGHHPAVVPASILLMELFVHGWDLAHALDRPFDPTPQLVAFADEHIRAVIPPERGTAFGAPLPEDGSDPLEALLAFTGRGR